MSNLVGYYCVGFPVASAVCLLTSAGVRGIFIGHLAGVSTIAAVTIGYMAKVLNWQDACDVAIKRSEEERQRREQRLDSDYNTFTS